MTRTKRTLKPAGYIALAVLGLLVIGLAMTAWHWVDSQFIHPYGYGIPTHLVATLTPTPQVLTTRQPTATSELDTLPPLVTATPPSTPSKVVPSPSPSATEARADFLPWAGKVAPGKPAPDEVVKSITAGWGEIYKAVYDYPSVKANGRPGDKAWWTKQIERFFTGAARQEWQPRIESWFKPGSTGGPGFIENGMYTFSVKSCMSDTECALDINLQSGQWWTYDIPNQQFGRANALQPFQWRLVMQYDQAAGQWKIKELAN
jgi:hypothetical protein